MPYMIRETFVDSEIASSKLIPHLDMSDLRPYIQGNPLSQEQIDTFPKKMVIGLNETNKFTVPDVSMDLGIIFVSEKVKNIIERFEDSCNLFIPLNAVDPHDNGVGTYYFMIVTQKVDGFVYEKTKFREGYGLEAAKRSRFFVSKFETDKDPNCVLRKSVIDGLNLWRGTSDRGRFNLFCSDKLGDALIEAGVTGWDLKKAAVE